jgi:transcriptional regulator with XRE-family HTH domain
LRYRKRDIHDEVPFRRTDEPEVAALSSALALQVSAERARRGLTQVELAALCGTTQSAVARLERGDRPPRLDTLLRIANALDCELDVRLRPRTEATP